MRAEDTLQFMSDFYPLIFPCRRAALEHLFCTIGNGAEWIDGEIVYDDHRFHNYVLKEPVEKAIFEYTDEEASKKFQEDILRNKRHAKIIGKEFNEEEFKPFHRIRFWSGKTYLKLYNPPDNIKDDWKALLEECKEYIRKEGLDPENGGYLKDKKDI